LVYILVYLLDEAGIFLVAVFTLRSTKLEEKHGRVLKLIGGVLMLTLALVMLIDPTCDERYQRHANHLRHSNRGNGLNPADTSLDIA
jgi:drug/metabolite transporter superfamily protein YnfA